MLGLINRVLDKPDAGKLLLRLAFGILLIFHGWHKMVDGVGAIAGMLTNAGLPTFIAYGVFAGEVIAPVLLILGILTGPSACFSGCRHHGGCAIPGSSGGLCFVGENRCLGR